MYEMFVYKFIYHYLSIYSAIHPSNKNYLHTFYNAKEPGSPKLDWRMVKLPANPRDHRFLRSGTWKKKPGDHKDPVGNHLETGDITDISHLYMEKPS